MTRNCENQRKQRIKMVEKWCGGGGKEEKSRNKGEKEKRLRGRPRAYQTDKGEDKETKKNRPLHGSMRLHLRLGLLWHNLWAYGADGYFRGPLELIETSITPNCTKGHVGAWKKQGFLGIPLLILSTIRFT